MNKDLKLLDDIEDVRQRVLENPSSYTTDYAMRLVSAIVAEYFGFKNRNNWTDELKKHSESKYSNRIATNQFHI